MKQYMNKFLTIVALLMLTCLGARAEQTVTIVVNPSDGGTVTHAISGGVCTLTAKPASGYYLTVENLTATTTLSGAGMQDRTRTDIEVSNETLAITASDASSDPSGETTYTFNMPTDQNLNVEVTAEFKTVEAINPTVTLAGWTYGDNPNVPQVGGNPGNGAVTFTYQAEGATAFTGDMPTNAGTHTIKAAVAAAGKYAAGEATTTFTISKAAGTISYATASVNKTYNDDAFTNELTNTGDGTVSYESNNIDAATVDEQTGEVTIIGDGEATITATVTDGTNYTYATKTASYLVSVGTAAMEVKAENVTVTYDGQPHSITVNAPQDATIAYSKDGTTYNLNESPSYTDAGTYTVFYKVTKDNYTDVTGSAIVTINKAAGTISYATASVNRTYGDAAFTNELTITGDGSVSYKSSEESVATVDANGMVTIVGDGEATITASVTDGTNYTYATKTATYQLIVTKPQEQGYNLWIGDTQVTKDNQNDVFGDAEYDQSGELIKAGSYIFNPTDNILLITDNQRSVDANDPNAEEVLLTIKSCLPNLKIYLNGKIVSKVKSIVFDNQGNNSNEGTLTFTCFSQTPGTLVIKNDDGLSAISGFKNIDYEYSLVILEPEGAYLANNELYKAEDDENNPQHIPANTVTVGPPIDQCDEIIPLSISNLTVKDAHGDPIYNEDGSPQYIDTTNGVIDGKVLVTAPQSNDSDSDEGIDDSDGNPGIVFEGTMTDEAVAAIADAVNNNELTPGGQAFAEAFTGITILLPPENGTIHTIIKVDPGYRWHLSIDGKNVIPLVEDQVDGYTSLGDGIYYVTKNYEVTEPTYCYIYLVKEGSSARSLKPIGKRDKAHGKMVSIGVKVVKSAGRNTPSEASGGVIPEETDIVTGITDNSIIDNHIRVDNDRWYNLNGQQIDKPTKRGLYIYKGKKVFLQ